LSWFIVFVSALIMLAIYISRYEACRSSLSKRPTFVEFKSFKIEDDSHRRNIRAARFSIGFLLIMAFLALFVESEDDIQGMINLYMKFVIVALSGLNFYARSILYDEANHPKGKFDFPAQELTQIMKKTSWLVRGKDLVSSVVNLTTILSLLCLIIMFYNQI